MTRSVVALFSVFSVVGCADVYLEAPDGDREVIERGQVVPGSCSTTDGDVCDGQSAGGCWCDEGCVMYGDCCADIDDVCVDEPMTEEPEPEEPEPAGPSCASDDGDTCGGQSADGCWCDDQCAGFGDCCPDVTEVCEDEPVVDPDPEPDPDACSGTETYTVTVDVTWDPSNVPNPHFSPVVGAVHSDAVSFWSVGGLATSGIEVMAETGGTSPLQAEIGDAIAAGTASSLVLGGSIPTSPGSTNVTLEVTGAHSLVTLVTMVAPSPDWFVGVGGLALCDEGEWLEGSVSLTVWDAGTDSGSNFTSGNADTNPAAPISASSAFSGPAGTMTFTRQ